jgi:predicted flap endonuclease-1-like 5' DNA nuclease
LKRFRNKCLRQKLWEDTLNVVRQLDKIGPASAASLVAAGITSFEKLEQTDPRTIESVQITKNCKMFQMEFPSRSKKQDF